MTRGMLKEETEANFNIVSKLKVEVELVIKESHSF